MRAISSLLVSCVVIGSATLSAQTQSVVTVGPTISPIGPQTPVVAVPATPGGSGPFIPVVVPASTLRLTNLSTRAKVTAEAPLVTGFAISGATSRTVLVRAAGPALTGFGVAGAATAPRLRLHDANGNVVSENAGWSNATGAGAAIAMTGAFPFVAGSADSALVVTLAPGKYSAEVIADAGAGGVALVEIYDVEGTAEGSRLTNVSTLSTVSANGGEVISGFILSGTGTKNFLVRGIGPTLSKFNVTNTLADPNLTVFNSGGTPISTNNDWSGTKATAPTSSINVTTPATTVGIAAGPGGASINVNTGAVSVAVQAATSSVAISATGPVSTAVAIAAITSPIALAAVQTGAFALDAGSADAALVVSLAPGAYTVQVNGVGATSGAALLEIYELQ